MNELAFIVALVAVLGLVLVDVTVIFLWMHDRQKMQEQFNIEYNAMIARFTEDRERLEKKNESLMDRVMAQDLTEFKTMEKVTDSAKDFQPPVYMSDKDEKEAAERERGDRQ